MAKLNYSTTISIDTRCSAIHCFTMLGNDAASIEHRVRHYSGMLLDDAFFTRFKEVIKEFSAAAPSESVRKIALILPDDAVALDTVNVPTMRSKRATKNALDLTLGEIYRNVGDLKVQAYISAQNRQYTTFSTAAVQKHLLTSLYAACSENKWLVDTTTYAASSTIGAAATLDPKLKNATYLFLDIKDTYSRFIFVVNGRTVGSYPLPFGLSFLSHPKYVQEDMLFDHTMAELTVLNAREKAKARRLTVLAEDTEETEDVAEPVDGEAEYMDGSEAGDDSETMAKPFTMTSGQRIIAPKVMAKKTPRKLPRSMQRPIPETDEGIICENFRVFIKWALSLLSANERITQLGKPEFVCVNIPESIAYVLNYANEEQAENGIEFRTLGNDEYAPTALAHLELYGGFFPKAIHPSNKL